MVYGSDGVQWCHCSHPPLVADASILFHQQVHWKRAEGLWEEPEEVCLPSTCKRRLLQGRTMLAGQMAERRRMGRRKLELGVSEGKDSFGMDWKKWVQEDSILCSDYDFAQLSLRALCFIFYISVFIYATFWIKPAHAITA